MDLKHVLLVKNQRSFFQKVYSEQSTGFIRIYDSLRPTTRIKRSREQSKMIADAKVLFNLSNFTFLPVRRGLILLSPDVEGHSLSNGCYVTPCIKHFMGHKQQ